MIHFIKNNKWIIALSLVCIIFGILTFFTFIDRGFIKLNDLNLQILLTIDLILLGIFFGLIIRETFRLLKEKRKKKIGSETSSKYIVLFTSTTLLPSILIAVFSLVLFNVGLQKYFDKQIKYIVNSSAEVATNYVNQTISSIEADVLLMVIDVNRQSKLFYDNPKQFLNLLTSQRLLRRLDEVHLLDSSGNLLMSTVIDASKDFVAPTEEAFAKTLDGKPVRIPDEIYSKFKPYISSNVS